MEERETSPSCKELISYIEKSFEKINIRLNELKKDKEVAESRTKVAEELLSQVKSESTDEMKKMYNLGFASGIKESLVTTADTEGGFKLVQNKN